MKFLTSYKRLFIITLLSSLTMSPLLISCGSSDTTTAGIGGTGITQGKITGFGSIFVNGIEFDTNRSQFEVDGNDTLNEADLSIGMVVKITGSVSSDGLTGTADNVVYDDEIQGPVKNISKPLDGQKTLFIFDQAITIDESTTSFDNTSFTAISEFDIVEISGFKTSPTGIEATYVKWTGNLINGDKAVELKGKISNLKFSSSSFTLAGATINFNSQTEIEAPDGILSDGLFVEVEGILQSATEILAEEIEVEDEGFEDGVEISLQGVIANLNQLGSTFTINGQRVDASNAEISPNNTILVDGLNVEVAGDVVNGVLIAEEVELREGEIEIKTFVSGAPDLANNRLNLGFTGTLDTIQITVNNQTSFEDEFPGVPSFSLDDINNLDFVKIEGINTGSQIIATQVKRLDPDEEDTKIQGAVEEFSINDHITILGIEFEINLLTSLPTPVPAFGDIVKITDEDPADGLIDKIELEDD